MYGHIGYRRTFRIREFYALLAFLIGISIGFILTTRTRIQVVSPPRRSSDVEAFKLSAARECSSNANYELSEHGVRQVRNSNDLVDDDDDDDDNWIAQVEDDDYGVDDQQRLRRRRRRQQQQERRKLIFVGVMTAQKYLETRAMAVHRTWAKHLNGRVVFFAGADAEVPAGLPVVRLAGVDDTYPPQKKSFLMLKYMYEHYGDDYEWFMRADDDVYVRGDRLESLLRSVNSSRTQFIGQAGTGNKEEFGQLNLERDENFCMGGPGIVFSRETLRRVAPNVRHCLRNLYSTHEDVEVGRCVRRFADIPCTWSYEMQSIFYHNNSGEQAFTGNLKQKEVHRAITLHPIKHHTHLYRLHKYIESLAIGDLLQKTLTHYRDMRAMVDILRASSSSSSSSNASAALYDRFTASSSPDQVDTLGKAPSLTKRYASSDAELIKWDFIQHTIYSHTRSNPRRKLEASLRETRDDDVVEQIMSKINKYSRQRGRIIDFKELLYGYHRFDVEHGVDYILDMLLVYKKYAGRKMTIPVRKHVYAQQAFTELEVREAPPSSSSLEEKVNFILPLSGRFHIFQRFMRTFESACLVSGERTSLSIVVFADNSNATDASNSNMTQSVLQLVRHYRRLYGDRAADIEVDAMDGPFSRAMALQRGAARFSAQPSSLLFFVDVDMHFGRECLKRIRLNTIKDRQAYFPIVFSQYDPTFYSSFGGLSANSAPNQIHDELGYWRQFGFGIVSIYHADLNRTGGLDVSIRGWGKEDVDFYNKVVAASNLSVFRAVDPDLVHIFHPMDCDAMLPAAQLSMCLGSRAGNYASVRKLTKIFYSDPKILKFFTIKSL